MKKNGKYLNLHENLIKDCKKGNSKAQFELYRLYYKAMFNTTVRIVGDFSEAEDIMQEAFLKAFQNLDKYKAEVSFGAWLKKIVINKSLDFLRKRKTDLISIEDIIGTEPTEENYNDQEFEEGILIQNIVNEIAKLPEGYRIVLSLYLLEGYDHDEISKILNISASTSRSQYIRAKKKLIEKINDQKLKNEKS